MADDRSGRGRADQTPSPIRILSSSPQPATHVIATPVAPYYSETPQESEASLQDLTRLIRERWRPVVLTMAIFFGLGLLYCLTATKMYTARTMLEIQGYSPLLETAASETTYGKFTERQEYVRTQIQKLNRLSIADKALADETLREQLLQYSSDKKGLLSKVSSLLSSLPIFSGSEEPAAADPPEENKHYQHPYGMLQSYLKLLSIQPIEETSLVELAATTADPVLSRRIANTHAEAFIDHIRSQRQTHSRADLQFLEAQAEELKDKVSAAEQRLAEYAENNELLSLSKDQNLVTKEIGDLTALLAEATAKRVRSESLLREIESTGPANTALDDHSIGLLRVSLKEAEAERADLGQKVTSAHPAMQQLNAKIAALQETILSQRKEALTGLRANYETDAQSERKLMEQIERLKGKAHETNKRLVKYNILEREYESTRDLYHTVLRQLKESQISAANSASNISITDYAATPQSPSSPLVSLIMILSVLAGGMVGLGIALALHLLDNTLKTSEEVAQELGLASLGVVPSFTLAANADSKHQTALPDGGVGRRKLTNGTADTYRQGINGTGGPQHLGDTDASYGEPTTAPIVTGTPGALPQCVTLNPRAPVSESFRTIRASLLLSSADRPPRIIMTTSAKKGEGKTTFACNLAVTLAQAGHRTLLIDADVRQSRVHERFNLSRDTLGLVDYLAGQASLTEVTSKTPVENLFVITGGSTAPNPAELIGSDKMGQLVELLGLRYDYILLDSPPVLPVADSLMLSRIVDGVVVIVRSGVTEKQLAREATRRLKRVNAHILGVVMNDVNVNRGYGNYDTYGPEFYLVSEEAARRASA